MGLRGTPRLLVAMLAVSFGSGLMAGLQAEESRIEIREVVRSLPLDRFVDVTATIDAEWRTGRDGVRTWVDRFHVETLEGPRTMNERLSIYAPRGVPTIGDHDQIRIEGFLRESARGRLYISVKSPRLVDLRSTRSRWHPRTWNRRFRTALDRHVAVFPEHENATSLIRAVTLGDGSALSPDLKDSYRRGGTYHLLVFSGMQIAFAAALIALVLRALRLAVATDASLVVLALLAPAFAGNEPSVSRASMMIGIFGLSRLLGRPTPMPNLLFLSASIRLLLHPDELISPGLVLTYAATFGLVVAGKAIATVTTTASGSAVAYGLGAELCTQPLTLIFFRHYVMGGFLITLLLAPVLAAILLLSIPIAISLASGSDFSWPLIDLVARLDQIAVAVNELSSWLGLSGFAPAPSKVLVISCFLAVWLVFVSTARPVVRASASVSIFLLVPLMVIVQYRLAGNPGPEIEFLDVGQGDAILIRSEKVILIDGGGSPNDPEFGRRTLIPLLADRAITSIDVMVMSHPDIDHCGGLLSVAKSLRIGEIWISARHLEAPCTRQLLESSRESRLRFLRDGQRIEVGDVFFTVTLSRLRYKKNPLNNGSVVLTAELHGTRIILTGDIESEAERTLIDEAGDRLRGEILKVAHHGSRTSTTSEFLKAVRPRLAVISCEAGNSYGHPAEEVLGRLRAGSAHVLRTDHWGSMRIRVTPDRIQVRDSEGSHVLSLTRHTASS